MATLKNKYLVLIAEDDPDDQLFMMDAWRELDKGCELVFFETGVKLLEFINAFSDQTGFPANPSMVFLDLNMPQLNGKETLRQLRSQSRLLEVPVFILTTSASDHEVEDCYAIGANAFLQKPHEFDRLKKMLDSIFNHWTRFLPVRTIAVAPNEFDLALPS